MNRRWRFTIIESLLRASAGRCEAEEGKVKSVVLDVTRVRARCPPTLFKGFVHQTFGNHGEIFMWILYTRGPPQSDNLVVPICWLPYPNSTSGGASSTK